MRTFFGAPENPEVKKQSFEQQPQLQRADSVDSLLTAKTRRLDSFAPESPEKSSKGGEKGEGEGGKLKSGEGEVKGGGEIENPKGGEGEVEDEMGKPKGGEGEVEIEIGKPKGGEGEVENEKPMDEVESEGEESPIKPRKLESVFDEEATSHFRLMLVSAKD